jgi:hypothetical protein
MAATNCTNLTVLQIGATAATDIVPTGLFGITGLTISASYGKEGFYPSDTSADIIVCFRSLVGAKWTGAETPTYRAHALLQPYFLHGNMIYRNLSLINAYGDSNGYITTAAVNQYMPTIMRVGGIAPASGTAGISILLDGNFGFDWYTDFFATTPTYTTGCGFEVDGTQYSVACHVRNVTGMEHAYNWGLMNRIDVLPESSSGIRL